MDIPRLKDKAYVDPGEAVHVADLEAWEEAAGVKVDAGDAVLAAHRALDPSFGERAVERRPGSRLALRHRGDFDLRQRATFANARPSRAAAGQSATRMIRVPTLPPASMSTNARGASSKPWNSS